MNLMMSKFKYNKKNLSKGFTLIEVLAALAIVAIGLTALFSALSQGTRLTSKVEERMIANWIASNTMTELKAFSTWPQTGATSLDVQMAGRVWYVNQAINPTEDENIRRIEINVSLDKRGEYQLANLYSYFLNPKPKLVDDDQLQITN